MRTFTQQDFTKGIDCSNADGFCGHYKQCLEQWVVSIITTLSTGTTCSNCLTGEDIQCGSKKRKIDEMRKQYIEEKCYTVVKMWEYEGWNLYKTDVSVKEHLRESLPYKHPLRQDQLLDKIILGDLSGYIHCDIKVPEPLRAKFAIFPPFSKRQTYVDKILHQ